VFKLSTAVYTKVNSDKNLASALEVRNQLLRTELQYGCTWTKSTNLTRVITFLIEAEGLSQYIRISAPHFSRWGWSFYKRHNSITKTARQQECTWYKVQQRTWRCVYYHLRLVVLGSWTLRTWWCITLQCECGKNHQDAFQLAMLTKLNYEALNSSFTWSLNFNRSTKTANLAMWYKIEVQQ